MQQPGSSPLKLFNCTPPKILKKNEPTFATKDPVHSKPLVAKTKSSIDESRRRRRGSGGYYYSSLQEAGSEEDAKSAERAKEVVAENALRAIISGVAAKNISKPVVTKAKPAVKKEAKRTAPAHVVEAAKHTPPAPGLRPRPQVNEAPKSESKALPVRKSAEALPRPKLEAKKAKPASKESISSFAPVKHHELKAKPLPPPKKVTKVPAAGIQHAQEVYTPYVHATELMQDSAPKATEPVVGVPKIVEAQPLNYLETSHMAVDSHEAGPNQDDLEVKQVDIEDLTALAQQEIGVIGEVGSVELSPEPVSEWLPVAMEQLGPEEVEAAEPQLDAVIELAQELQALRELPGGLDEVQVELIEQQLEELTGELLGRLGLEPDEVKVKQFINLISKPEFTEKLLQKLSIKRLNELGTYEYKIDGMLQVVSDMLSDIKQKFHWVGHHPVKLAV